MTWTHIIYIPLLLVAGLLVGMAIGRRALRAELDREARLRRLDDVDDVDEIEEADLGAPAR